MLEGLPHDVDSHCPLVRHPRGQMCGAGCRQMFACLSTSHRLVRFVCAYPSHSVSCWSSPPLPLPLPLSLPILVRAGLMDAVISFAPDLVTGAIWTGVEWEKKRKQFSRHALTYRLKLVEAIVSVCSAVTAKVIRSHAGFSDGY